MSAKPNNTALRNKKSIKRGKSMKVCSKCGKELSEAEKFCPSCGSPAPEKGKTACASCGAELEEGNLFCSACGARVLTAPVPVADNASTTDLQQVDPEPVPTASAVAVEERPEEPIQQIQPVADETVLDGFEAVKEPNKKKRTVNLIIPITAVVLVLAIAAGVLFSLIGKKEPDCIFYLRNGEIYYSDFNDSYKLTEDLIGKSDLDEDDIGRYSDYDVVQLSSDGKRIFYPDKITDLDDGFNLYMKKFGKEDAEAEKVASDVYSYKIDKNGKNVLYSVYDDGSYTVYKTDLNDRNRIAKEVEDMYVSENLEHIWYVTESGKLYFVDGDAEPEKVASDVSYFAPIDESARSVVYRTEKDALYTAVGTTTTKISSDVNNIVYVFSENKIYYSKETKSENGLSEFVTDSKKEADANFTRPQYPYWSDYDSFDAYEAAYDAYQEELKEYRNKLSRDEIREELEDATYSLYQAKELYLYNGKKSVKISDEYYWLEETNEESQALIFGSYDKSDIKKTDIADIDSIYDLEEEIDDIMDKNKVYYMVSDEKSAKLSVSGTTSFAFSLDGKTVYYTEDLSDKGEGLLYRASVSGTKLSDKKKIDSGVYLTNPTVTKSGQLYYFKDKDGYVADLYLNGEKVDEDVYVYSLYADENTLYYLSDYDDDDYIGTLRKAKGKNSEKIARDVYAFDITSTGRLIYVTDVSSSDDSADIYVLKGSEGEKIAGDVKAIAFPSYSGKWLV